MAKTLGLDSDGNYYWIDLNQQDLQKCIVAATKPEPNQKWNVDHNVDLTSARLNSLVVIGENDESTYRYTTESSNTVVIGFLMRTDNLDDNEEQYSTIYIEKATGMILRAGTPAELARSKPLEIDQEDYSHVEHFNFPLPDDTDTDYQQLTAASSGEQRAEYDNDDTLDIPSTSKKRERDPKENAANDSKHPSKLQAMLQQRKEELKKQAAKIIATQRKSTRGRKPKTST